MIVVPGKKPLGRQPGNELYRPTLRWHRAYPEPIPANRPYVVDPHMLSLAIRDGDFGAALRSLIGPFVFVEWDMALDPIDCRAFEACIAEEPDRLWVAPYYMHNVSPDGSPVRTCWRNVEGVMRARELLQEAWGRDVEQLPGPLRGVALQEAGRVESRAVRYDSVEYGTPECDTFGFGCIYFPERVLRAAWADRLHQQLHYPNADSVFSWWCADRGERARICWDCQPKHIHW